jgi:hypothetical protein
LPPRAVFWISGIAKDGWEQVMRVLHVLILALAAPLLMTSITACTPQPNKSAAQWAGHWQTRAHDKDINIKLVDNNRSLFVEGYGTYGFDDPERVKRGSMSAGQFAAQGAIDGPVFEFAVSDNQYDGPGIEIKNSVMGYANTLPYTVDLDYICKIKMALNGDTLIVEDNMQCGGHNFSFRDTYFKSKEKVWWWDMKEPVDGFYIPQ